jgi:hypothetical protein
MTTKILIKKLNKDVGELKDDVREMKRFLFAPMKDVEGEYKESFVRKILARPQSRGPFHKFVNKESFLAHVRSKIGLEVMLLV